jgi:arsenite methyltransferase
MYDRCQIDDSSPASSGEGGCVSILRSRPSLEKLLGDAGFALVAWEDHTRYLKGLVAQMILSGEPCEELTSLRHVLGAGCGAPSGFPRSRPGYFLLVAQKLTKGDMCNG